MKYEWKKSEKGLYLPKSEPVIISVPDQQFFMIKGKGNPNDQDFAERVGALYSLAYAVRMMPRNGYTPNGYFEYTVYPLEGVWDLTEVGRAQSFLDKDELIYTIMIRQPDFVTKEVADKAFEIARKKKPNPLLEEVTFERIEQGTCVQMMHLGPYDEEPESFSKMREFITINGYSIKTLAHREIYIKSVRGQASQEELKKLKTVLRYQVTKQ